MRMEGTAIIFGGGTTIHSYRTHKHGSAALTPIEDDLMGAGDIYPTCGSLKLLHCYY